MSKSEVKGPLGIESCLLEEVDNISSKPNTTADLDHPDAASDFGPPKVDAYETVLIGRSFTTSSLLSICVNNHSHVLIDVVVAAFGNDQIRQYSFCFIYSVLTD